MPKTLFKFLVVLGLVGSVPGWAQTSAIVPAEINVDFGELSLTNNAPGGELYFGERFPGDINVRPVANVQFLLRDTRLPQGSSYHLTVQATSDFVSGADSFSASNLVVNGAAVNVVANGGNTNPLPTVLAVSNQEIRSVARRVLEANQGTTANTGFGEWLVSVDAGAQDNWFLSIPVGTPNGNYTATVTFTVVSGL